MIHKEIKDIFMTSKEITTEIVTYSKLYDVMLLNMSMCTR